MLNCTTEKYADIYAPWLQQPHDLLDLVDYEPGLKLLDLCGGTGAVSLAAHCRGWEAGRQNPSDITLFDINPRCKHKEIETVRGRAENLAIYFPRDTFDVVVCRQAMGYLNPSLVIPAVFRVLQPGGQFVFSTFIQPRPYSWKSYKFRDSRYFECHYAWGEHVVHLQWRLGTGWDVTHFRYHPAQDIRRLLCLAGFKVLLEEHGRGLRWVCTKPKHLEVAK